MPDNGPPPNLPPVQQEPGTTSTVQFHHCSSAPVPTGILATARVKIISAADGLEQRALIDGGSTNSQITKKTAKKMNLQLRPANIPMSGPANVSCGTARYVTTFQFTPWYNPSYVLSVTALVVDKVSGYIPSQQLKREDWPHLQGLMLADPEFEKPDEVEILLGTDIVWSIMENQRISGFAGQPLGIKTTLGWLVAGPNDSTAAVSSSVHISTADLDYDLRRFFEQEEPPAESCLSAEESACERHFADTHKRDATGRFTVRLPLKQPTPELGSSRQMAIRRFISVETKYTNPRKVQDAERLRQLQQQWGDYKSFMQEYESLGHMERVPPEELNNPKTYYIPHHAVTKESSTTTKLRVVFDASAATSNGTSLNDCMMVGPTLQDTIWDIMLRFRLHPIAFTADIAKMYRQIRVTKEDADLQRIIWREQPSLPMLEYRLLTVTYGTASAPYLAVKCLQQLARDEETNYPLAATVALRNFYVDDAASSCPTLEEAKETVQQLISLCMSGGLELRKWTTNSQELLQTIPESMRETNSLVELNQDTTIKTLGIYWNPVEDSYSFRLTLPSDMHGKNTKRIILSQIAKIYDPLGWLAPAIIVCKIFMQRLWRIKFDWDDILPAPIQQEWTEIRAALQEIERIQIPRCIIPSAPLRLYLIGCCDASTKGISSAVYLACEYNAQPSTCQLVTSKTRVAPVKHVTLPRLELNGCVLLSELLKSTLTSLQLNFTEVKAFTDSTIALHWVRSQPSRWKLYIRRRVQNIQDNVPMAKWFHIAGARNPADCASRGITGQDLLHHPLWWNGVPEFFNSSNSSEAQLIDEDISQMEAETQVLVHHSQPVQLPDLLQKFSSFFRLRRVVAYVQRFVHNCRNPTGRRHGSLSVSELNDSRNCVVILLQQAYFPLEREALLKGTQLNPKMKVRSLQPFIDNDGLLRVGGRIKQAKIPFSRRNPILLPRNHHITSTLIMDIHVRNFHSTATSTLLILQQQYWIINGLDSVKAVIRKCVVCVRHRGNMMSQVMGDLPYHRINPSRPFCKVGVDYAGPLSIKPMVRSKVTLKCWLAIFVCFVTRAVHIEVVSSLSTDCFIAALRRFIARRGNPSDIFSDCGTNFKGADKALREFFVVSRKEAGQSHCAGQGINWHFNPPGAPHFGGLWEAGVKSIKHHLIRVMGSTTLTYEEMHTLVTQIEGILNSRPLVPASSDPSDLEVLTPAHFLIGAPITAPPEPNLCDSKENHLQRWTLLQHRQQLFWKRWSLEYLTRMQQRPKWMKVCPNLQVGQLVIVKDDRLPPLKWKLARVIDVHPGSDGQVRVATLKTTDGEIKRPVVKLSLLPINQ